MRWDPNDEEPEGKARREKKLDTLKREKSKIEALFKRSGAERDDTQVEGKLDRPGRPHGQG